MSNEKAFRIAQESECLDQLQHLATKFFVYCRPAISFSGVPPQSFIKLTPELWRKVKLHVCTSALAYDPSNAHLIHVTTPSGTQVKFYPHSNEPAVRNAFLQKHVCNHNTLLILQQPWKICATYTHGSYQKYACNFAVGSTLHFQNKKPQRYGTKTKDLI